VKTLLVTGFDPFGKFRVNSSWESIRGLDETTMDGWKIVARRLPVSYRKAGPALKRELRRARPNAAIAFGLAPDRSIRLERVALNVDHAEKPDNDGRRATDRTIDPRGPLGLESKLPLRAILNRLRRRKFKARLSFHAGTYLCNHVFFVLRRSASRIPAGFVHLPPVRRKTIPGWTPARLRAAVREIIRAVIRFA
jgi:pyroglutamyl-peptidase